MGNKQNKSSKLKAADKALLKDVAEKLKNRGTLFPEKVARAKEYIKNAVFLPEAKSKNA